MLWELEEDWDSYGASPIKPESAAATIDFVLNVLPDDMPVPSVVPTNRGGIQLEWHRARADLEIEIESAGRIEIAFEDEEDGGEDEFEWTDDFKRLEPLLNRISRAD